MRKYYLEDIPLEEAQARLYSALSELGKDSPLEGESVDLSQALGRVTAEPIYARLSAPHYHSAAVDGYALHASATHSATETRPISLSIGGISPQAIAVNTGEALPEGCNAVVMIEHVQEHPDHILIHTPLAPYQHVRLSGEDMVATELVLPANHSLRPVDLGAIAGSGNPQVSVRRRPRVVIIPTGSELVPADQVPSKGQIIEYNSLVLSAQVQEMGGIAEVLPIAPDERDQLAQALDAALARQPDCILMLSGSSAGSRDFTAGLVEERGELLVHGVAVRPGHPVIIGILQGSVPIIGVPGYPVSAALTGEIFLQALLGRWLGKLPPMTQRPRLRATLTRKLQSPQGDDDFVRVTLAQVGERLLATPLSRGAGVITSLLRADGLAHIPRFDEGADAGQSVEVMLYRDEASVRSAVCIMGSHDPLLDLLASFCAPVRLSSANVGSLGGLIALKRGEAHLAGTHLLDEATGEYNVALVKQYLPSVPVQLVTFAHREQGLMVARGNPLGVQGLDDLPRLRFVNRQRGSGTRLLLDYELRQRGMSAESIQGYQHEEYTHLGVAVAIASGLAEAGLGVRSAAIALGLDFVPVAWERYDFAIPQTSLAHAGIQRLLNALNSTEWRQALSQQVGYRADECGRVVYTQ